MIAEIGAEASEKLAVLHAQAFLRGWSAAEFAALLQNPAAFALMDAERQGFILAWVVVGEAEILTLAVQPQARRRGVGAALVAAAARLAHARGGVSMRLEVAVDNVAGRMLYAKLGFEEIAVRPGYYADGGVNAVVMRRALPM